MNSKLLAPDSLRHVRIVLSHTSHPGNIGSAARAMKTMGFGRLFLVNPRFFPDPQAEAMASGAGDVLAEAQVCSTLAEALYGCTIALAMTARRRELATEPQWAREAACELASVVFQGEIALVFGNETSGLSNDELAQCNRWAMIPANPTYSSLNLGAAVQLICYELRLAMLAAPPIPSVTDARQPATLSDIERLLEHLEMMATDSGFLDPERPGRLMLRLRRLFARAALEREEVNVLRGLLASFQTPTGKRHQG